VSPQSSRASALSGRNPYGERFHDAVVALLRAEKKFCTVMAAAGLVGEELVDRLTHHCHIFEMNGEIYRFRESMKAKKNRNSE
jgi:hypothetical protein